MFLSALLVFVKCLSSLSLDFSTSLSVLDGDSWIFTSSKTIYLGRPLKLRCSATSPDNITISRKEYDRNVTTQLVTKFGSEVQWEISETGFSESGVYECISRGISNILTVYIYSIIGTNDVTVPTIEYLDKIGNFNFTRRQLDDNTFLDMDRNWMSCTCVVGSVKLLDIVTVTWKGGLFGDWSVNHSQINQVYSRITTRDPSIRAIRARLRLNLPLWSSVWWPLLGVSLELFSLVIVFAFFRYCRRQRNRYGLNNDTTETGVSFGRSRLLDIDVDGDQVEMMKVINPASITTSSTSSNSSYNLHTRGPIPYILNINSPLTGGYSNPNLIQDSIDAEVDAMVVNVQKLSNEHDLNADDDYFWDSDTGNNDEDKRIKTRSNHQTRA
ncbi:hypothetical protein Smp_148900 [Schistosoma mansoni]|uniref:hypothetical protein n=1 Tax=Schistosoma mansoni TaxID=6183 RepID=UPI0001A637BD|nr:hypothetical protein Smp_148900 [Schistosoma mansoni]|eukprot:XP_018645669.1 hypothetical protein Smp_148900 [Schistosoma mansoni]